MREAFALTTELTAAIAAANDAFARGLPDLATLGNITDQLSGWAVGSEWSRVIDDLQVKLDELERADEHVVLARTPAIVGVLTLVLVCIVLRGEITEIGDEALRQATLTAHQMLQLVDALGGNRRLAGLLILLQAWSALGKPVPPPPD